MIKVGTIFPRWQNPGCSLFPKGTHWNRLYCSTNKSVLDTFYKWNCNSYEDATKCCSVTSFSRNWWHKNLDFLCKHVTRNTTYKNMHFKSMPIWECIFQYDIIKPRHKTHQNHPELLIRKLSSENFCKGNLKIPKFISEENYKYGIRMI